MSIVPRRTHTDSLFYNFKILKKFDQIQCHNVLFLHKILNNKVPESVCETFAIMLHSHNTRCNNHNFTNEHKLFWNLFYQIPMN